MFSMKYGKKLSMEIRDLQVRVGKREILHGVNFDIPEKGIIAIIGPNASGKSTLANVIAGNPEYIVTKGSILWHGKDLLKLPIWERARLGIFLSFQNPVEVPGLNILEFLHSAFSYSHVKDEKNFDSALTVAQSDLSLPPSFFERSLNEGFSGGEKKRSEMLQMQILRPKFAILDEIDSGLDIDARKMIAKMIQDKVRHEMVCLLITHSPRFLRELHPERIYIMKEGKIVAEGGNALLTEVEQKGYAHY
jgi:Fe-S cluster assembly ATP-binding protein